MRVKTVLLALLGATLSPLMASAADLKPQAARYTYVGYMGGVKIGWAKADIIVGKDRYLAKMNMETGGMVGWFVEWRHSSVATGATTASQTTPFAGDTYRNDSFWKETDRYIEVAYDDDDVASIADAAPHPVKDEGRPAIPEELLTGVLDPLSAITAIGRIIDATGSCNASFGVFDGRRRYQLQVMDNGDMDIGRSRYAPYGGEARRCDFIFKRVAGFKKLKSDDPTRGRAYFRRVAQGSPLMPVQVAADTKYGGAVLHLKDIELLDPDLAEQALAPGAVVGDLKLQ